MIYKVVQEEAEEHSRTGVAGRYYQLPEVDGGTTVARAVISGEHGERKIGDRARIYFILKGKAKFVINGDAVEANENDVVVIPSKSTYNLWSVGESVEVLLVLELLKF